MTRGFILPKLPEPSPDARLSAPAARRNLDPIRTILLNHAPKSGRALELADTLRAPVALDATRPGWSTRQGPVEMILLVNLLHLISETSAATVLTEIVQTLAPGGTAFVYGPFLRDGQPTSDGDTRFHARLRAADPATGYKDLAWAKDSLRPLSVSAVPMPANNQMLIARKVP